MVGPLYHRCSRFYGPVIGDIFLHHGRYLVEMIWTNPKLIRSSLDPQPDPKPSQIHLSHFQFFPTELSTRCSSILSCNNSMMRAWGSIKERLIGNTRSHMLSVLLRYVVPRSDGRLGYWMMLTICRYRFLNHSRLSSTLIPSIVSFMD